MITSTRRSHVAVDSTSRSAWQPLGLTSIPECGIEDTLPRAGTLPLPKARQLSINAQKVSAGAQPESRDGTSSPLSIYLREAAEVPLLTRKEEVELSAAIQQGDEAAREYMIRANLRLVVKIAREYENFGLPLLDLINEGNIGLMRAVERFDPRRGAKFSTYSALWIRQHMRRALASQGKTITLPLYVVDQAYHLGQTEARLREIMGREATVAELGHELGLSPDRIAELRRVSLRPTSLDAPLAGEDSSRLADVVPDESADSPEEQFAKENTLALMRETLPKLPPREATILRLRFGLDSGQEKTLEEIGSMLGVTRERIRQLQNSALNRLRQLMVEREPISIAA